MQRFLLRARAVLRDKLNALRVALTSGFIVCVMRMTRLMDAEQTRRLFSAVTRKVGPHLREHRIGRANLAAAFPEKSPEEIETVLTGVWNNLGLVGAEMAHLDHIWKFDRDHPETNTVAFSAESEARFLKLRDDGKGALIFASHLANWEVPALPAPMYGLESAVLFRRPNIAAADRTIQELRAVNMGEMIATTRDAPVRLAAALQRGVHIGMLVDQHFGRGVDVTFFGRPAKANPLLARLVRQIDVPIHGVRAIRLPDNRFHVELTEAIEPARGPDGKVDIQGTMQRVTSVIEGWVREHPEQWLWLHRRWR